MNAQIQFIDTCMILYLQFTITKTPTVFTWVFNKTDILAFVYLTV